MDYDPRGGRLGADNLYAGYSWGRTTVGVGHSLLNAVDEQGSAATTIQSQQLQPFLSRSASPTRRIQPGRQRRLRLCPWRAAVCRHSGRLQLELLWPHCRVPALCARFGSRDETQYLYSFTLANFGSVGDIRRSNTVFRDPSLPPPTSPGHPLKRHFFPPLACLFSPGASTLQVPCTGPADTRSRPHWSILS